VTAPDIATLLTAAKQALSDHLKRLLESKHLYQSVEVSFDSHAAIYSVLRAVDPRRHEALKSQAFGPIAEEWLFATPRESKIPARRDGQLVPDRIHVLVPDIKSFCARCDRVEAFNVVSATPLVSHRTRASSSAAAPEIYQVFALAYECQSCKARPEVFMVKRNNLKLQLCGRAPIAHVAVPPVIPKHVRGYYSGAVVAFQSGQVLAALFMLRTLVEQFIRGACPAEHTQVDQVMDSYMASLPEDFKDRFPSMAHIYERLSSAIHAATDDETLFREALADTAKHFDARRVFGL
jgi:hypothetical protein